MNNFRDDELVTVQGRTFPVVGGRLRLVHEGNEHLAIKTELVKIEVEQVAVVRAMVTTAKGEFTGTGVASAARDARLVDALIELAETRAVARALRFAGYGVETCGVEELTGDLTTNHHTGAEEQRALRVVAGGEPVAARQQGTSASGQARSGQQEPVRQPGNGNGGNGNRGLTVATAAQLRAIRTLARQVGTSPEAACTARYGHGRVEAITVREASGLIDGLKAEHDTRPA